MDFHCRSLPVRILLGGLLSSFLFLSGCHLVPLDSSLSSGSDQIESGLKTEKLAEMDSEEFRTIEGDETKMTRRIAVRIQDQVFPADLADTVAADQLYARLEKEPLTITAHDYGGFEKVGDLGQTLSASDHQMTTESGDLVLYQSDQIVLFYGSNRWFYTKLASLKDTTGLEDALGSGEISYTLFIPES